MIVPPAHQSLNPGFDTVVFHLSEIFFSMSRRDVLVHSEASVVISLFSKLDLPVQYVRGAHRAT